MPNRQSAIKATVISNEGSQCFLLVVVRVVLSMIFHTNQQNTAVSTKYKAIYTHHVFSWNTIPAVVPV